MTTAEIHDVLAGFLERRSEYQAHVVRRSADWGLALGETDYALVWSLLGRLKISAIHIDDAAVAALFRAAAPARGLQVNVHVPEDALEHAGANADQRLEALFLFNAANKPVPTWPFAATGSGALAVCYGVTGMLNAACIDVLQTAARGYENPLYVPLSALAPPLWGATALLVADSVHRAMIEELLRHWTATFSGDDLDVLRLAEDNLALRARQAPGGHVQEQLAALEAQVAALRRTAMAQEATITELSGQVPTTELGPAVSKTHLQLARR